MPAAWMAPDGTGYNALFLRRIVSWPNTTFRSPTTPLTAHASPSSRRASIRHHRCAAGRRAGDPRRARRARRPRERGAGTRRIRNPHHRQTPGRIRTLRGDHRPGRRGARRHAALRVRGRRMRPWCQPGGAGGERAGDLRRAHHRHRRAGSGPRRRQRRQQGMRSGDAGLEMVTLLRRLQD